VSVDGGDGGGGGSESSLVLLGQKEGRLGTEEKACSAADKSMSIRGASGDRRKRHHNICRCGSSSVPGMRSNCCLEEAKGRVGEGGRREGLAVRDGDRIEGEPAPYRARAPCAQATPHLTPGLRRRRSRSGVPWAGSGTGGQPASGYRYLRAAVLQSKVGGSQATAPRRWPVPAPRPAASREARGWLLGGCRVSLSLP